ncbi:MAG: peptide-methionine (S)-S-oxide reductase MsrA [Pseudomonadota bacterium]|jgi:peptide-methionine (S)-S-oxide reductase
MSQNNARTEQHAVLGGGCFWCLEAVFTRLRGVSQVVSGYCGGQTPHPSYDAICSGSTGHAEVVRVSFQPDEIDFTTLLQVFFSIHDPTTLNRQGHDQGTQYRSVIFPQTPQQERQAREMITELGAARIFPDPIVTAISPAAPFYPAEGYHQRYYDHHAAQPYCRIVIHPKLAHLRQGFAELLRDGD